jgi:hypothetical protein
LYAVVEDCFIEIFVVWLEPLEAAELEVEEFACFFVGGVAELCVVVDGVFACDGTCCLFGDVWGRGCAVLLLKEARIFEVVAKLVRMER